MKLVNHLCGEMSRKVEPISQKDLRKLYASPLGVICHDVIASAFDGPGHYTFNNVFLQKDKYDNGGQYSHYHCGHSILPV